MKITPDYHKPTITTKYNKKLLLIINQFAFLGRKKNFKKNHQINCFLINSNQGSLGCNKKSLKIYSIWI